MCKYNEAMRKSIILYDYVCVLFSSFSLNFSYVVKPDVGPELDVPGRAMLVWPQLLENPAGNLIEFPTTTIGSSNVSH